MLLSFAAVQSPCAKSCSRSKSSPPQPTRGGGRPRAPRARGRRSRDRHPWRRLQCMADDLKARARDRQRTALPNFRPSASASDAELDRADRYGTLRRARARSRQIQELQRHLRPSAGNDALHRVAQSIRETVRTVDFRRTLRREEFAVIVPQVDRAALTTIAERVRINIELLPPINARTVTVSIGAASTPTMPKNETRSSRRRRTPVNEARSRPQSVVAEQPFCPISIRIGGLRASSSESSPSPSVPLFLCGEYERA